MYFNYSPHGYCVEEAFASFVPEYLQTAVFIADKKEKRKFLLDNLTNQFEAFEHFVRIDICELLTSVDGFYSDNFTFLTWVRTVAKKHEYRLLKEYMAAINAATDRAMIKEELITKLNCQ